jgi:hypothetical protein
VGVVADLFAVGRLLLSASNYRMRSLRAPCRNFQFRTGLLRQLALVDAAREIVRLNVARTCASFGFTLSFQEYRKATAVGMKLPAFMDTSTRAMHLPWFRERTAPMNNRGTAAEARQLASI